MSARPDMSDGANTARLELRLLGPMELTANGQSITLPRSKKTRALLAFLAMADRPQHRGRLCSLLWDMTDDPRGALRWSLSRLRKVLGDHAELIQANNTDVSLNPAGFMTDAKDLTGLHGQGLDAIATDILEDSAALYNGEFLEGLELPDSLDFNAWCIDQREQSRKRHSDLLTNLIGRLRDDPQRMLPHARRRAQVDLFDIEAQRQLLELLLDLGKVEEAQRRFDHARRLFAQVSKAEVMALELSWRALRESSRQPRAVSERTPQAIETAAAPALPIVGTEGAFVGRKAPLARLKAVLNAASETGQPELVLITGEPGVGKSRLAEHFSALADAAGFAVVRGRAFEAESSRPLGPWMDALTVDVQQTVSSNATATRDDLFDNLRARLVSLAAQSDGLLLVLDDLHWFDRNSAELVHYIARTYNQGPLLVLMLARDGELPDNEAAVRLLRGLRQFHAVGHIELEPLSPEDIAALFGDQPDMDAARVYELSSGNPLYALEFARAHQDGLDGTPPTILQLVRERITSLPDQASDVLRWGAVLGHAMNLDQLEDLVALPADDLMQALERLEQSSLLRLDTGQEQGHYTFAHDLIREAVYGELSQPRRRLMHRKVAHTLEHKSADPRVASELAHHASLAGEALLGVRACITAGHHALRMFANSNAETLARRGLRLAAELDEENHVAETLNLLHVLYSARTPDREKAAVQVQELAERALDLGLTHAARQGFQMLSYLRWEGSSLADAHDNILQAERVSRVAADGDRVVALAQAARCLVLLERNLQQAEAFVIEADAVARRQGNMTAAVSFAHGMIASHRGDTSEAIDLLLEARDLARQHGEHLVEFGAIEHMVMLELDRGGFAQGLVQAEELVDLGGRVRPGAEAPVARALLTLAQLLSGGLRPDELSEPVDQVRRADAKYELSYLLTRWAEHALAEGQVDRAHDLAEEALAVARIMGRKSEIAMALVVLASVAEQRNQPDEQKNYRSMLDELDSKDISARSRKRVEQSA